MSGVSSHHRASIEAAKNMLNGQSAAAEHAERPPNPELELQALTGGQIAELVEVAIAHPSTTISTDPVPYEPLNPFAFQESQLPAPTEAGRLQTRLCSLKGKLNGIGSTLPL